MASRIDARHFVASLMLVAVATACGQTGSSEQDETAAANGTPEAVPVATVIARSGTAYEIVEATGTVAPWHQADIGAEVQGRVVEVAADVGDWVEQGDLILRLDPELYDLAVEQAEAQLLGAEAAFRKAKRDYQRNQKLYETRDISKFALESSLLQMQTAQAAYLTAKAALATARRQRRNADIAAPFSGWVARRFVDLGQTVAPGVPVARVVDITSVKVEVGLAEKDVVKVAKGQRATLTVDAFPGQEFAGQVATIGPEADPRARSFPVEIRASNTDQNRLRAGMVAKVRIFIRELKDVVVLPRAALLERSGQTLLFAIVNGQAQQRQPVLAAARGDSVAVLRGMQPGEEIVVAGQENLADGTRVIVQNQK